MAVAGGNAGVLAAELDNDGLLDLYFAGMPLIPVDVDGASPGHALHNTGDVTFERIEQGFDLSGVPTGGLAAADDDDDGRVDIAIATARHPQTLEPSTSVLLHNVSAGGASVTVELSDPGPNTAAVGARIYGELPDGRTLRRDVIAGSSYLSTESPWPTLGLGAAGEIRLEVCWPGGSIEDFGWHPAGGRRRLVRGEGAPPSSSAPLEAAVAVRASGSCLRGGWGLAAGVWARASLSPEGSAGCLPGASCSAHRPW